MPEFKLVLSQPEPDTERYILRIEDKRTSEGIYVNVDLRDYSKSPKAIVSRLHNAVLTLDTLVSKHYTVVEGEAVFSVVAVE